ncbi:MAG: hypothetical protein J6O39_02130 [Treponema sp.]|nr:hypothetical protein [Treponema sp.]
MKIKLVLILSILTVLCSCEKPVQWKQKKAESHLEFLTFTKGTSEKTIKRKLDEWKIDYTCESGKLFSAIEADWITFRKIEYSQIFFYLDENKKLFKIKAYIPGEEDGKKLLKLFSSRFTESRRKGQKPREHYFAGISNESCSLKYNRDDEVWFMEMNFIPD